MDVQSVSVRAQDVAKLALDSIKLDKVVDTAFAAGTVWAVLSAVRNATKLAGPASYTAALGYLGGGLGVVGGVVNLACIGMSTYIATEGLCVDSGMVFVDRLIKEGVPEEDIYEVDELWKTFQHSVDMMVDCGNIEINPTNVVSLVGDSVEVIRGELV